MDDIITLGEIAVAGTTIATIVGLVVRSRYQRRKSDNETYAARAEASSRRAEKLRSIVSSEDYKESEERRDKLKREYLEKRENLAREKWDDFTYSDALNNFLDASLGTMEDYIGRDPLDKLDDLENGD
jgi:hypothetical protein